MSQPRHLLDLFANPWARIVLQALGVLLLVWLISVLSSVLTPLLVGLVVAYMIEPLVASLTRKGLSRLWATNLVFGAAVLAMIATLAIALPMAWREGRYLYQVTFQGDYWKDLNGDGVWQPGEPLIRDLNGNGVGDPSHLVTVTRALVRSGLLSDPTPPTATTALPSTTSAAPPPAVDVPPAANADPAETQKVPDIFDPDRMAKQWLGKLKQEISDNKGNLFTLLGKVGTAFGAIGYWALTLLLLPVYAYVFSLNLARVSATIVAHIPPTHRESTLRILGGINRAVGAFFRGRLAICAILGIVATIGFFIAGVPSSLVLGALMGLATAVPLAPVLVMLPAALLLFLGGAAPWQYWVAGGTFAAVQGLEPLLITVIMGKGVEMHPIVVLLAILCFGILLGPIGVILAVPLAATARILWREFAYPHLREIAGLDEPAPPPAPSPA